MDCLDIVGVGIEAITTVNILNKSMYSFHTPSIHPLALFKTNDIVLGKKEIYTCRK